MKVVYQCAQCGATVRKSPSTYAGKHRFCAAKCHYQFRTEAAIRRFPDRFWSKVDRSGDCWLWTGYRRRLGYGEVQVPGLKRPRLTHRVAWELTNGPIPDGLSVCHACDNPPCCNPAHLFLGTHQENMQDAGRKGILSKSGTYGTANGLAKLTEAQVREIRALTDAGVHQRVVAKRFGVGLTAVGAIFRRETWRHVPEDDQL
jgi:hypothetical protein